MSARHLRGTALAYVKRAPFPPCSWNELKALLLKRFQPRDLTATYKAQFRSRRRRQTEDIYAFVEALQKLADMAWQLCQSRSRSPGGDPKVKIKEQTSVKEGSKGHQSAPTNREQLNKEKPNNDKQRRTAGEQVGTQNDWRADKCISLQVD